MTFKNAEDWLTRKFQEFNLPRAQEIYHKGDEFKGIVFARFSADDSVVVTIVVFHFNCSFS